MLLCTPCRLAVLGDQEQELQNHTMKLESRVSRIVNILRETSDEISREKKILSTCSNSPFEYPYLFLPSAFVWDRCVLSVCFSCEGT